MQLRVDVNSINKNTATIAANLEKMQRRRSDPDILQHPSAFRPTSDRNRPTSAPPVHLSNTYGDPNDPFSHMNHPNFPFNSPTPPPSPPQPVFNVTNNSNFNAPNSMNYKSGTVSNNFSVGHDDHGTYVNNYTYGGSKVDQKMAKMERKMGQKVGSPRRGSRDDGYYGR
jgi:hypothetical protein